MACMGIGYCFTSADTGGAASTQMSDLVIYALAALMGFVLGPILLISR